MTLYTWNVIESEELERIHGLKNEIEEDKIITL